ncbi:MAG: DNA starvation/stationary phase protection protein, partial [Leptolyngbya sp. SIO4C5]|nr:DNA starvation/stationary phase protection protein [Leptolyngbya sp. SIO4C5]
MPVTETLLQTYGEVADNSVLLERSVTEPIVEGLGAAYASFMGLYLQYQKHHFVVEGSEYYMLHQYFSESYEAVQEHAHEIGERLHGLGGIPTGSFGKLAELCCFEQESDDIYRCRLMVEHDLKAEQSIIEMLRRLAGQADIEWRDRLSSLPVQLSPVSREGYVFELERDDLDALRSGLLAAQEFHLQRSREWQSGT